MYVTWSMIELLGADVFRLEQSGSSGMVANQVSSLVLNAAALVWIVRSSAGMMLYVVMATAGKAFCFKVCTHFLPFPPLLSTGVMVMFLLPLYWMFPL